MTEKKRRGFATWTLEQRRLVAARGGMMAHLKGVAHTWTVEEARIAGAKGGSAPHVRRPGKRVAA